MNELTPETADRVLADIRAGFSDAEIVRRMVAEVDANHRGIVSDFLRPEIRSLRRGPLGRSRGRPAWNADLFALRLAEATAVAGSSSPKAIASKFRGLSGEVGIDPSQLRTLRRRFAAE